MMPRVAFERQGAGLTETETEIEIFRTGRHTSMQGEEIAFDEAQLDAIAASYDPAAHHAPVVVGHPATDAPAWGWVSGLGRRGDRLVARLSQVDPAFAELVRAGRYKAVSPSFYKADQRNNPKPGQMYLRHLGFLGAQPPAVKGLAPAQFAELAGGYSEVPATFSFADAPDPSSPPAPPAPEKEAPVPEPSPPPQEPALPPAPAAALAPTPSQLAAREAELAAREAAFAERERAVRRAENQATLRQVVADGRPLPVAEERLLDFMEALDAAGTADFAEGAKPLAAVFGEILRGLPRQVDFGERSAPPGDAADAPADPHDIAQRAAAFQEEQAARGLHVTMTQAVARVAAQQEG